MSVKYILGDIHDKIKEIETDSIDMIYTDPPFGTTENKWDKSLMWDKLFPQMWRVLKPNGVIVLYASIPFNYRLLKYETPKYHYVWKKNRPTGFFASKKQPLRCCEEIYIYYKKQPTYNPQMEGNDYRPTHYLKQNDYYGERNNLKGEKRIVSETEGHIGKYPLLFKDWKLRKYGSGITRSDEQIDYFIKTYTNKGDMILDMSCCNDFVGMRCKSLDRSYIGVDIEYREGDYEEYNQGGASPIDALTHFLESEG